MNYEQMKKVAEFQRVLADVSGKWRPTPTEVPVSMSAFYDEIGPYLPDDQMAYFDALPEVMARKAAKYQDGVWRVSFVNKSATELHLVQLGIQPDRVAEYLQITFSLNNLSQMFATSRWEIIDEVVMLVGPVKL